MDANAMRALASQTQAQMRRSTTVKFKTPGSIRVRFTLNGGKYLQPGAPPVYWRKYGTHVWKTGNDSWARFVCDYITNERPCPIDAKISEYRQHKKNQEAIGGYIDPLLDKIIEGAWAQERYLINAFLSEAPGLQCDPNTPVTLDLTKGQFEIFTTLMVHYPLILCPVNGNWIRLQANPRAQGGKGVDLVSIGAEPASPINIDPSKLADLDDVLASEHRNTLPASRFNGNFLHPVDAMQALAAPPSAPQLMAPQQQVLVPTIVSTPASVVQPAVQPTAFAQPVVQPAPVAPTQPVVQVIQTAAPVAAAVDPNLARIMAMFNCDEATARNIAAVASAPAQAPAAIQTVAQPVPTPTVLEQPAPWNHQVQQVATPAPAVAIAPVPPPAVAVAPTPTPVNVDQNASARDSLMAELRKMTEAPAQAA